MRHILHQRITADHILHRMLWILTSHGFGLCLSGERCKSWGTTMWVPQQPGLIDFCIFLPDPLLAVVAECTLISTNSCFEATGHFFKFCGCTDAFWFRRKCQGRELDPIELHWTPLLHASHTSFIESWDKLSYRHRVPGPIFGECGNRRGVEFGTLIARPSSTCMTSSQTRSQLLNEWLPWSSCHAFDNLDISFESFCILWNPALSLLSFWTLRGHGMLEALFGTGWTSKETSRRSLLFVKCLWKSSDWRSMLDDSFVVH